MYSRFLSSEGGFYMPDICYFQVDNLNDFHFNSGGIPDDFRVERCKNPINSL